MKILEFPGLKQTFSYDCGATAIEAILDYYGFDVEEEKIIKLAGTNKKDGTSIKGVIKTLENFKLKFHAGELEIEKIKKQIDEGHPEDLSKDL